jgi:hypothetical protein
LRRQIKAWGEGHDADRAGSHAVLLRLGSCFQVGPDRR